ncbi:hypothetical protein INR49_009832, partial [Caranx melampygus]
MMSDSPASLLFLPSLRVFPHSAGRSWVSCKPIAQPLDVMLMASAAVSLTEFLSAQVAITLASGSRRSNFQ